MADKNYTKREQDHYFTDLFKRMDKQDVILDRIEGQTTRTNGRVTRLEDTTKDYGEVKTSIRKLENYKWYLIGIGATIAIVGGIVISLIYNVIDTKINSGIQAAFNDRFSNIKVTQ